MIVRNIQGASPSCRRPPCQLACFQEFRFQALGGSLIRGSEGLGSSIIRILFGSEALGSSILCILRGSEALGSSTIRILRVPKLPGAQNQLGYRKCASNREFLADFSRQQPKIFGICSILRGAGFEGPGCGTVILTRICPQPSRGRS